MDLKTSVDRLARQELHRRDWSFLRDVLRDEIRWGTRGEMNEPGSETLTATFDTRGDAEKFRRLAIRFGFAADVVEQTNVTEYEGMDFVVTIRHLT